MSLVLVLACKKFCTLIRCIVFRFGSH